MRGWVDGCMGGWMDGHIDGWMHGWMDACMDGSIDLCVDGWMGGWTDRQIIRQLCLLRVSPSQQADTGSERLCNLGILCPVGCGATPLVDPRHTPGALPPPSLSQPECLQMLFYVPRGGVGRSSLVSNQSRK